MRTPDLFLLWGVKLTLKISLLFPYWHKDGIGSYPESIEVIYIILLYFNLQMLYFKDFVTKFCLAACQEKEVLLSTTKDWLVWCKRSTNTTHAWLGLKLRGEILPSRIKVSILSSVRVLCHGKESVHIKGRKSVMGYENPASQVSCKIDENNQMCMKRNSKSTPKRSYYFRSIESRKLS